MFSISRSSSAPRVSQTPGILTKMPRSLWFAALAALLSAPAWAGPTAGQVAYESRCVLCHGGDGSGSDRAPSILPFLAAGTPEKLAGVITKGIVGKGMPAFDLPAEELEALVGHVMSLRPEGAKTETAGPQPREGALPLAGGGEIRGLILNESGFDAQVRTPDGKLHLLRREGDAFRPAKADPSVDWPSYHGNDQANRHSPLDQINKETVARLAPQWFFPLPGLRMIEGTPVVLSGVMYVTAVNQVYALDAETGREIWRWTESRTQGLIGDAAIGLNRGVAVDGDRLFTVTDHAHVVALDRWTGEKLWDATMADYRDHYGAIAAPLIVGELAIVGVSGGDTGLRGFLDAYHVETGERAWRFWTIPAPGEPLSETWGDPEILKKGCGATWLTGSYDAELDLLYWPVGNPCPDLNGDRRPGDNLYTDSVIALRPKTGELVWHFQFTPHDTHDWDAQEPLVLVDEEFDGKPRKLLVQGNRNGFLYVLDRVTGEFLLGESFSNQNWAERIDENGRPVLAEESDPTEEGSFTCPAIRGATNWMSTAYNPGTKLFYLLVHDSCNVYTKTSPDWERGKGWLSGSFRPAGPVNQKFIRALDIQTGRKVWEYAQTGETKTYSGVLSTAGGLVFFGEDSGAFAALDARSGEPLWHFQANQDWKASPMTYMVGGRQFVAIASGMGFWAFALQ
ncbi:MAG: PQQ-binding-like beta-propeller repeat protein [Acidobacteria bacterium]|nr:PQQ-binding-like beta-propeller repeat protein [Acidobacteriota bacterium]